MEWGERWFEEEEAAVEWELMRGPGGLKSESNVNAGAGGARSIRDSGKSASWDRLGIELTIGYVDKEGLHIP